MQNVGTFRAVGLRAAVCDAGTSCVSQLVLVHFEVLQN